MLGWGIFFFGLLAFAFWAGGMVGAAILPTLVFIGLLVARFLPVKGEQKEQQHTQYPEYWGRLRHQVFQRDGYICGNCGMLANPAHCHHIVPLSRGGTNRLTNLRTLCDECHHKVHPHMT